MDRISRRRFLKGTIAVGAGAVLSLYSDGSYKIAFAQSGPKPTFQLQIIHTNDHHARIEPVFTSPPAPALPAPIHAGVSRRKTLIDQLRAEAAVAERPTLLLDAGDVFQGTLYFNQYNGQADLAFYNAMGYDAMAIGNHEFDKQQQVLADFIRGANFPVLSANIVAEPSSPIAGLYKSRTVITRGGKKIGIFGLTTEDTAFISLPGPGVSFTDAIRAARAQVNALRRERVDYIIALTHLGYERDLELARTVSGISLIVGGHSHTPLGPMNPPAPSAPANPPYPTVVQGPDDQPVVVTTDWEWGRWLGNLTLSFNQGGKVVAVEGRPLEVLPSITPDAGFEQLIANFKGPIDQLVNTVIGKTNVVLDGERPNVRSRETNLGNLIAEAMLLAARPDGGQIAITNGGGIRASIGLGDVTVGEVLTVLPFGNTIARADLTGAQLKLALEQGVRNTTPAGAAVGNFPQVAGIRFTYDPTRPSLDRVTALTLPDGTPINPAATYRVITNNFMLGGGDGYTVFLEGTSRFDYGFVMSDEVEEWITNNSPVTIGTDGRIAVSTPVAMQSRRSALATLGALLVGGRG